MSLPDRERTFSTIAVIALAALLILLGVLQYRWSGEISEAASARMQADLQDSMMSFRQAFTQEMADVCFPLQPGHDLTSQPELARYSRQVQQWKHSSPQSALVNSVYVTIPGSGPSHRLLRLDSAEGKFVQVASPPSFRELQSLLQSTSQAQPRIFPSPRRKPGSADDDETGPKSGPQPQLDEDDMPWAIYERIPALVHPIPHRSGARTGPQWLIIELDRTALEGHLLPELARRQFGLPRERDFKVAVVGGNQQHPTVIYSSDPDFGAQTPTRAAAVLNIWGPPVASGGRPGEGMAAFRSALASPGEQNVGFVEPIRLFALQNDSGDRYWQLVVEPRSGPVEEAVARLRRRNLAVSFGILLVLAATTAVIIIATHRARKLAQIQMDFVTGVTHELRTPLAVILSAAENIQDGVINKQTQLDRYGGVIYRQTKQLMQLVEQVLLFASTRQTRLRFELQPVEVPSLIGAVIENVAKDGVAIEPEIEPNLPRVEADTVALTQCLQNLITNAIKYGGADHWVGVKAWTSEGRDSAEVNIRVQDRGIGIEPAELRHIFEAFYRSPSVLASNIHGTGLGLPLTKRLIEALGGRISVTSQPGLGSSFTLHLRTISSEDLALDSEVTNTKDSTIAL